MIDLKGYYLDFINNLSLISKSEDLKSSLNSLEINIIKEILNLIGTPKFYYIPNHIEDYEFQVFNSNTIEINQNIIIETDIESYELVSKNTKIKVFSPTLIIHIKEKYKNFSELSLISNNKIRNNMIIMIRKHNGFWQFPTGCYSIINGRLEFIELFKKRNFEFINSQKEINIQECMKTLSSKNFELNKKFINLINNKNVDFLSYPKKNINYYVPAFVLTKAKILDVNQKVRRMNEDNLFKDALDDIYYYGVKLQ